EIFIPVLAGTATTLAPFFPLLFWKGIIGKFMIYLPTMLILTLAASLIVAFIFNPVFAVSFMKPEGRQYDEPKKAVFKKWWFWAFLAFGAMFHVFSWHGFANFLWFMSFLAVLNNYVFREIIHRFQERILPGLMNRYEKLLRWVLKGWRPVWMLVSLFVLFPVALFLLLARGNKSTFFPSGDPNFIYVYLKMPVGTSIQVTDSVTHILEKRGYDVLKAERPSQPGSIVESIITNVANSANNPRDQNRSVQPNLGRIQVSFVEFEKREGKHTRPFLDSIRTRMQGIPGASIEVAQEDGGPPTDPPVNIEIVGDNFSEITQVAKDLSAYLDTNQVYGVENLKMDVDLNSPEITLNIDRQKAMMEGLSTAQVGMEVRAAVFGREVSKLKDGEDEYKIQVRYNETMRNNLSDILNMRITFMDMNTMQVKSIPISAIASVDYSNTSGAINRKNV
ncbi:MAG TPA: efflux RND transporter permease subunit, partial [Ferruginibacter sp.]|nr:efflux RND transporter permease subunit [Ferruginibacter sp.]